MSKRVLIVTTQRHFNFGTMLQCYALQHYVESLGYVVEVLDYTGYDYSRTPISKLRIFLGDLRRSPLKYIKILLNIFRWNKRERLFKRFLSERIKLTVNKYPTFDEVRRTLPVYDIYIAGSDQIWNPRIGGFKPVYFLQFVDNRSLKISYAASFGIDTFDESEYKQIHCLTAGLTSISCREQSGVEFLRRAGINSTLVVDPTLLLPVSYWRSLSDKEFASKYTKKYILTYFLSRSERKTDMLEHSFKDNNLRRLDLCVDENAPSESLLAVGPEQFLSLIDNCELLITDSFHGMVFALIFHKNFYIVPRNSSNSNSQNTRIVNLLEKIELMDRWLPSMVLPGTNEDIDYTKIEPLLQQYISESSSWLRSHLKKIGI